MRVTEQQLYNMICESIHCALNENDTPIMGSNRNTFKPISRLKAGLNGAQSARANSAAKVVGGGVGIGATNLLPKIGGGIDKSVHWLSNLSTPSEYRTPNVSDMYAASGENMQPLAAIIIGAAVVGAIIKSLISWKRARQQQVPKNYLIAKQSIDIAVVERNKAQQLCIDISDKLTAAIDQYNQKNNAKITKAQLLQIAQQNVEIIGKVPVTPECLTINFKNKYAQIPGVSVNENENNNTNITTNNQTNNTDEKQALIAAMGEFVKILTIWLDWTDYINLCVNTIKGTGITFKGLMDGKSQSILTYYSKKGLTSPKKIAKSLMKKDGEQEKSQYDTRKLRPMTVHVKNPAYTIDGKNYVLVYATNENNMIVYFAIPKFGKGTFQNDSYTINYSPIYIERRINDERDE